MRAVMNLGRVFGYAWTPDIELADDEFDRGPHLQSSDVGEVYERAPAPRWTSREPQWPGLYFCRYPDGPARVVEVFTERRTLYFEWSDIPMRPVAGSGLQWSDRAIEEPKS